MMPLLLIDCYLDEPGAARNFLPHLGDRAATVVSTRRESVPRSAEGYAGVLITGSGASVLEPPVWLDDLEALVRDAARRGVAMLGVCFGHQVMVSALVGREYVRTAAGAGELGWVDVERVGHSPLFEGHPRSFRSFVSHQDEVRADTPGLELLARSEACAVQAYALRRRRAFGVQYHPEIGMDEAVELVTRRAPERGLDAAMVLSRPGPTPGAIGALLANFVRVAESERTVP